MIRNGGVYCHCRFRILLPIVLDYLLHCTVVLQFCCTAMMCNWVRRCCLGKRPSLSPPRLTCFALLSCPAERFRIWLRHGLNSPLNSLSKLIIFLISNLKGLFWKELLQARYLLGNFLQKAVGTNPNFPHIFRWACRPLGSSHHHWIWLLLLLLWLPHRKSQNVY